MSHKLNFLKNKV